MHFLKKFKKRRHRVTASPSGRFTTKPPKRISPRDNFITKGDNFLTKGDNFLTKGDNFPTKGDMMRMQFHATSPQSPNFMR